MLAETEEFALNDMETVLAEARRLAIEYQHGFIDYPHLFVAMLNVDCIAHKYCRDLDAKLWNSWLQARYIPSLTNEHREDLPLTMLAERIIGHCHDIAVANNDMYGESVHILLALLCMQTDITIAFQRQGILFEDIAAQHYGKPVKKFLPVIPLMRKSPYPSWRQFLFSASRRQKNIHGLLFLAEELYLYEKYDDCLITCEAGLSLDPRQPDLLMWRFYCHFHKRDFGSALQYFNDFYNNHPNASYYLIMLAVVYCELNRFEEAATTYNKVLTIQPDDADAFNGLGFNLYMQKRYAEAIPYYQKAIAARPDYAYPHDNLGFVKYKLGHPLPEVFALIDKALDLDKGNSYAYMYKGTIYMEQGNKEEARKNFETALKYGYTKLYGNDVLDYLKQL